MAGRVWKYGDNVDTDAIIAARYLNVFDGAELAKHCMEDIDGTFASGVQQGDIIVAGANFGCGSSREHAPLAIKSAGVVGVIAGSFARIFYRNAIDIGLPILECPEAVERIKAGDEVRFDLASGEIVDLTTGETFHAAPYPEFMMEIMRSGGLIDYVRAQLKKG